MPRLRTNIDRCILSVHWCLPVRPSVCLSLYQAVHPSLSTRLCMFIRVCVCLCLSVRLCMSVRLSACLSARLCMNICLQVSSLRKHAYSNILKILPPKNENFQIKTSDIFHISTQNIDCGYSLEPPRRGGSNEYHNICFWVEIRKIMYTPINPSFTI